MFGGLSLWDDFLSLSKTIIEFSPKLFSGLIARMFI